MRNLRPTAYALAAALVLASVAFAQPKGSDIVAAVQRNYDRVNDYRAQMSLTIKGSKVSINNMKMTVYFKKPNKLHVDAKQGFGLVPDGKFFGNPLRDIAKGASAEYVKSEARCGVNCHVVRLKPADNTQGQALLMWVDTKRSTIVAIDAPGPSGGGRSVWRHELVDGKYNMPSQIEAEMTTPQGEKVKATVKFTGYRINKGISDKIFKQNSGSKKSGSKPHAHPGH